MCCRSVACKVLTCMLLAGCEKPFEPIAPSDLAFSIYGHLDAAADTQWVRVTTIRESTQMLPGPIDAVVTLEELETGTTVVMIDSLSRYLPRFLGDVDLYAHNFSTTLPMVPGWHYRLTATRSDGATASATVLIPVFESPTMELRNVLILPAVQNNTALRSTFGTIRGTRYLGMILGREDVPGLCNWPFPIHQEFLPVIRPAAFDGDVHDVRLSWVTESRPSYVSFPPPDCNLKRKRILAIAAGEPWPHGASTQLRELSHPASINTIEGRGVGFVAGVQTHVFPFTSCIPLDRTRACTVTFGPRSATLVGTVTNSCTGEPFPSVRVRLIDPATNAIRYDTTDVSGVFRFQGLEPGASHSLTIAQQIVSQQVVPGTFVPIAVELVDFFPVEVVNLIFAEAVVDTVRIEMTHRRDCDQ